MIRWIFAIFSGVDLLVLLTDHFNKPMGTDFPIAHFLISSVVLAVCVLAIKGKKLNQAAVSAPAKSLGQKIMEDLKSGTFRTCTPQRVILKKGEHAFIAVPSELRENKTIGYEGGGASIRFRVAKGVSVGTGRGAGHAKKAMVTVANGELVITEHRVVFGGDMKSFDVPFDKLTNFQPFTDGIAFHQGSRSFFVGFADEALATACAAVVRLAINGELTPITQEHAQQQSQST